MIPISVEIGTYLVIPVTWYLFKRFANRNIAGDILAGSIIGVFNEFATEPLWNYHYRLTVYKDVPPVVIIGWGVLFALVVFFSEKLYCWVLKESSIIPYDKRIFCFDLIAGVVIGLPLETIGMKSGLWDYNDTLLNWNWGNMPFLNMPYEALVGYALFALIAPTFVRYWQSSFEGR